MSKDKLFFRNSWAGDGLFERWPKTGDGEPEEPVFLCHCKGVDMSDTVLVDMLETCGIPCLRQYPGNGSFGFVVMGMSGQGVDLYVPKSMHEEAVALCEGEEQDEEL